LLYFLEALRSKDIKLEDAVVVIDDPISSMDAHIAAGISSYLWARLAAPGSNAKCHQLFVLTHDFEFFRSWIHQLNSRDSKQRPHRGNIYELRTGIAADGMVSAPVFYQWDEQDRTRRARSEYHYLFWRVARTLLDCRDPANSDAAYDAMFVLPNTCRRMLESFLSFRYPAQVGNFTSQMEAASKRIDDPDFGVRVTQFLHGSSHNEEPDTQRRSRRQEAVTMLSTVMRFMHAVDEEHFKEMCKASKITAFDLVPPA
jgi:wobble nucleotide-excising tRNase